MSAENGKPSSGVLRRILRSLGQSDRRLLLLSAGMILLAKLCLAAAPRISGQITDMLADMAQGGTLDGTAFFRNCLLTAVLFLFGYGADGLVGRNMVRISERLVRQLRVRCQRKLCAATLGFLDAHPTGDLLSRVSNDMQSLAASLSSTVASLLGHAVLLAALLVIMLLTNPLLALIYVAVIPAGSALLLLIMKQTNRLFRRQNEALGRLNAIVSDTYGNHLLVKAYGCEEARQKAFEAANQTYYETYVKSRFFSGFTIPLSVIVSAVSFALICIAGGAMLIRGSLTIGEFQAFLFYGNMISAPLSSLSSSVNSIQTGLTSAERIYELLDAPEEPAGTPTHTPGSEERAGGIEFSHVQFGYRPGEPLLQDISFSISPGQICAVAGPSGAGKTTLINLLMRFYELWGGSILIDGVDARELPRAELRKIFGLVLQDTWLFDGTIAENIGYGRPGADMEEIISAAKAAQCHSIIEKLPEGYNTRVGGEKSILSEGEKQLVSIARAILSEPRILILDEATSQVDTRTEALIAQALANIMKGRTAIIIAHRLYTIRNASQIVFMTDGSIREIGSHEELMARKGLYCAMYESGSAE
ncbi:MAG: ABC transporter ATP-binding protein [Clostridia bacterium]|nr:ABC transporter ATP-binding protein [Clostridia bacterium]